MKNLYAVGRRWGIGLPIAGLLVLLTSSLFSQQKGDVLAGKLRIKVKQEFVSKFEQARNGRRSRDGIVTSGIRSVDQIHRDFKVQGLKRVFRPAGKFEERHRKAGLHRWYEVELDSTLSLEQAIERYRGVSEIEKAEPIYKKSFVDHLNNIAVTAREVNPLPAISGTNDPLFPKQWHYHNTGQSGGTVGADIDLPNAWLLETGSNQVIVSMMDGGVDVDHPDLMRNMWTNPGEVPGNNIDDDGNGYIDDVHGYGFGDNVGDFAADLHGTHVAGTMAAETNNGIGVSGVAGGTGNGDGVRLMSCAVFGEFNYDGFPESYVYAADMGAVISQNSWGYNTDDFFEEAVQEAIDYFIAQAGTDGAGHQTGPIKGGLVIFAAGNFDYDAKFYPGYYAPVIAVAATDHKDQKASYSNYGDWVDISAPGGAGDYLEDGVLSTLPNGKYGYLIGTSMACPHVSGVAALLISKFAAPGVTPEFIKQRIFQGADFINSPDFKNKLGAGRLNAFKSLHVNDGQEPLAATDLSVSAFTAVSVTLSWSSAEDTGDLPVSTYDIRYAESPIDDSNFSLATAIAYTPSSQDLQSYSVTGLRAETTYYFALKAADAFGNTSAISNVVQSTTNAHPQLIISPSNLTANLATAGETTVSLSIQNIGDGPLDFNFLNTGSLATPSLSAGQVASNHSTQLQITLSADGLLAGQHQDNLLLVTNDPAEDTLAIPITLHVTNNGFPIAQLHPASLDFGKMYTATSAQRAIHIKNNGSQNLLIQNISSDNSAFTVSSFEATSVPPFDSAAYVVEFSSAVPSAFTGSLSIETNDPSAPTLLVSLHGETELPALSFSPSSLEETLDFAATSTRQIVIQNNTAESITLDLSIKSSSIPKTSSSEEQFAPMSMSVAEEAERPKQMVRRSFSELTSPRFELPNEEAVPRPVQTIAGFQYMTDFESLDPGAVHGQEGWEIFDYPYLVDWVVDSVGAEEGHQHLRKVSLGSNYFSAVTSPTVGVGTEPLSTWATRIKISDGRGPNWMIMLGSLSTGYVITRLWVTPSRNIYALNADGGGFYDLIPATTPSGYFTLAVEADRATHQFTVYYNDEPVYTAMGFTGDIEQVAIFTYQEFTGEMDLDDFRFIDGGHEGIEYLRVQPTSLTIAPGSSANVNANFNPSHLAFGTFNAEIKIQTADHGDWRIPTSLSVTGDAAAGLSPIAPLRLSLGSDSTIAVVLRNAGGVDLDYSVSVTDAQGEVNWWTFDEAQGELGVNRHKKLNAHIATDGLALGSHAAMIRIKSGTTNLLAVPVTLNVTPPSDIFISADSVYLLIDSTSYGWGSAVLPVQNVGQGVLSFTVDMPLTLRTLSTGVDFEEPAFSAPPGLGPVDTGAIPNQAGKFPSIVLDDYFGYFFTEGDVNGQNSWAAERGVWQVESPHVYYFKIHGKSDGQGPASLYSPIVIAGEESVSSMIMDVHLNYSNGTTWQIIPQSLSDGQIVTRFQVNPDGSFQVLVEESPGHAVFKKIDMFMPGYNFTLKIEVERNTRMFSVFFNNLRVFTGKGFADNLEQMVLWSAMEQAGSDVFIDGLYIDGGQPALDLSPETRYVGAGKTQNVFISYQAAGLAEGIYRTTLHVHSNDPDEHELVIPLIIEKQRSVDENFQLRILNDSINPVIHEGGTTTATMTIQWLDLNAFEPNQDPSSAVSIDDSPVLFEYPVDDYGYGNVAIHSRMRGGPTFEWQDIKSTGVLIPLSDDDSEELTLPFDFPFTGSIRSDRKIVVSSNGYLVYDYDNRHFPGDNPNNVLFEELFEDYGLIAPYWDDLQTDAQSGIYYLGDSSKFVVQYDNVLLFGADVRNTFQVILYPDGRIVFQYLKMDDQQTSSTGIQGGGFIALSNNYPFVSDSLAVLIEPQVPVWADYTLVAPKGDQVDVDIIFSSPDNASPIEAGVYPAHVYSIAPGVVDFKPMTLTILENPPPEFTLVVTSVSQQEGTTSSNIIRAIDPNDDEVFFALRGGPAFVSLVRIDEESASLIVAPGAGTTGTYHLAIDATDPHGRLTSAFVTITVTPTSVFGFSLVNWKTTEVIAMLGDTVELDVADPNIGDYTIGAEVSGSTVGSVRFKLDGKIIKSTRNAPPYLVNYWQLPLQNRGFHILEAQTFSGRNATGIPGPAHSIVISMVNSASIPKLEIVNMTSGNVLTELHEGDVIDLNKPGYNAINLVASTSIPEVRSVLFKVNNTTARIDNQAPFAIHGVSATETPWPIRPGFYTVTATPYMRFHAWGAPGETRTVSFRVIRGAATVESPDFVSEINLRTPEVNDWYVYPVPFADKLQVQMITDVEGDIRLILRNSNGLPIHEVVGSAASFANFSIDSHELGLTKGIYYLQITYANGKIRAWKVIKD